MVVPNWVELRNLRRVEHKGAYVRQAIALINFNVVHWVHQLDNTLLTEKGK